ncbi:PilT domain-containing protein [mine drainage metagenome]|uniref:PilT domain-containing protein n=1 Tax=mine drainage metagenome TaxID=410659 RepID=T1C6C2_9ZZZZ
MSVFLDSYAIIEMARGNPRYAAVREGEFATSVGNLLEVYYVLLQSGEEDLAEKALDEFGPLAVDLPRDLISRIARFRLERKGTTGRRFSYVDASGYLYAQDRGLEFVTGALEFEGCPGMRFLR